MILKRLLKKHGVTQVEIANLLGRDRAVITNLMQGKRNLKAEEAVIIAEYIGVPVLTLLGVNPESGGFEEPEMLQFQSSPTINNDKTENIVQKGKRFYLKGYGDFSEQSYAIEVKDDSLNLLGILKGDIVIAETGGKYKDGDIVIVHNNGRAVDEIILRKYQSPLLIAHSTDLSYKSLSLDSKAVSLIASVQRLIRLF